FEAFQYGAERYAYPRNHHRPCFDAAHAVDPLFERVRLEQVFEREGPGYFRFARDADRPRHALESTRVRCRGTLRGAELIDVVVGRDVFVARQLLVGAVTPIASKLERALRSAECQRGCGRTGAEGKRSLEKLASAHVNALGCDLGGCNARGVSGTRTFDQHRCSPTSGRTRGQRTV